MLLFSSPVEVEGRPANIFPPVVGRALLAVEAGIFSDPRDLGLRSDESWIQVCARERKVTLKKRELAQACFNFECDHVTQAAG